MTEAGKATPVTRAAALDAVLEEQFSYLRLHAAHGPTPEVRKAAADLLSWLGSRKADILVQLG